MKKFLIALLLAATSLHAITVDSSGVGSNGTATSVTQAFTTGSGTNRLLLVGITLDCYPTCERTITSFTWDGQSLTRAARVQSVGSQSVGLTSEFWYLTAPAASTNSNIGIGWGGANADYVVGAIEFAGVNQSTPVGAVGSVTSTVASLVQSLTTTLANSAIACWGGMYINSSFTLSGSLTQDYEANNPSDVQSVLAHVFETTAQNYSFTNTYSGTFGNAGQNLIEIEAVTAVPTPTNSPSATPTITATVTPTVTPGPSFSPTATATLGCGVLNPATIDVWQPAANGTTLTAAGPNGNALINNGGVTFGTGTVPYGTSYAIFNGTDDFSSYSQLNYLWSNQMTYTWELNVNPSSLASNPIIFNYNNGSYNYVQVSTTGQVSWVLNQGVVIYSATFIGTGNWWHIEGTYDGVTANLYVGECPGGNCSGISQTPASSTSTGAGGTGNVSQIVWGYAYGGGYGYSGEMNGMRLSNAPQYNIPTTDGGVCTSTYTQTSTPTSTPTITAMFTETPTQTPAFPCPTVIQTYSTGEIYGPANYGCWDGNNFWITSYFGNLYKFYGANLSSYTEYPAVTGGTNTLITVWDGANIWIGGTDTYATLYEWNPNTASIVGSWKTYPTGGADRGIQGLKWDGAQLLISIAISANNGQVLTWNTTTNTATMRSDSFLSNVNGIDWVVSGGVEYILAACSDFWAKVNATTGAYTTYVDISSSYRVTNDGTFAYLFSYGSGNTIQKYNISTGALVQSWGVGAGSGNDILFDGTYLWTCGNYPYTVSISTTSGQVLCSIPDAGQSCLVYGGGYIFSCIPDNTEVDRIGVPYLTVSPTFTPTSSPSFSASPTISPSPSITPTFSVSPTATSTASPSPSPTMVTTCVCSWAQVISNPSCQ